MPQLNPNAHQVLAKAKHQGYAIGAFNAANLETLKAIVNAANQLRSPVIIESSPNETEYIGIDNMVDLVENYRERYKLPILLNLDHGQTEEQVIDAINAGYDLIHFDGSLLDYQENVEKTSQIAKQAHSRNLLVEAEINHITGSSNFHETKVEEAQQSGQYTDPDQAADFVNRTNVDTLTVFIGNVHGVFQNSPLLDIERLKGINRKVDCWLSLHGGSGIADEQIKAAIQSGIVKININTDLRLAFKQALLKSLQQSDEAAIYKLTPPAIEAMQKVVEAKIQLFGSVGKAD